MTYVTQAATFVKPMRTMKAPRLPRLAKPFLTETQRDALLRLCPQSTFLGARNAAIIWLLWGSGIRLSECTNLQVADLDWDQSRIRVFGKGQRERWAPFTKKAKKATWRYLSYRRDDLPQLWLTEERRPAGTWMLPTMMHRLVDRAGLHGLIKDRCHIFRRSWAWRNLKAGVSIKYIQLAGGWTTVAMLMRYVEAMQSEEAMAAPWQE
ncbi:MAG TPA: site-specific integrase [Anaerolineae bacterium]|nr:site-specific integrase [Anaerolineae bacterium]